MGRKVNKDTIDVPVRAAVFDTDVLLMRHFVGEGTLDGETVRLWTSPAGTPGIAMPDGRNVSFEWEALVRAAEAALEALATDRAG